MKNFFLAVLLFLFIPVTGIFAQQEQGVTSNLETYLITTDASGDEVTEEVSEIQPGDTIEYRLTYTNNNQNDITNLVPVLPIPNGMQYLDGSASPSLERASIQNTGGNFQSLPLTRTVTNSEGQQTTEPIPAEEYRRLQWSVSSLESGASVTLTARVTVNDVN
jgi:uncharacterized repeat protein (TIGR01451 family)